MLCAETSDCLADALLLKCAVHVEPDGVRGSAMRHVHVNGSIIVRFHDHRHAYTLIVVWVSLLGQ